MTSVLVVQTLDEAKKVKAFFNGLEFDHTFVNHKSALHQVEGLRFTQVWYTPDVLVHGMDADLFDRLYRTIIAMSVRPNRAFRLLG